MCHAVCRAALCRSGTQSWMVIRRTALRAARTGPGSTTVAGAGAARAPPSSRSSGRGERPFFFFGGERPASTCWSAGARVSLPCLRTSSCQGVRRDGWRGEWCPACAGGDPCALAFVCVTHSGRIRQKAGRVFVEPTPTARAVCLAAWCLFDGASYRRTRVTRACSLLSSDLT